MHRNFAAPAFTSGSAIAFGQLYIAATVGGSNGVRLNPKALHFVQDYMKDNWDELQSLRSWGRPYFSLIESILAEYGLPKELKYLAVIESQSQIHGGFPGRCKGSLATDAPDGA